MLRNNPETVGQLPEIASFVLGGLSLYLLRRNSQLKHEATHDDLTGLLNSRGLDRLLQDNTKPLALLYIDGTNQKAVNDLISHQRGDEAIVGTAKVIKESLRKYDVGARVGGDEFIVVLNDSPKNYRAKQALHTKAETLSSVTARMAERTEAYLSESPDLVNIGFHIAVGGAVWQPGMTIEDVRTTAEIDMYLAKGIQHQSSGKHR